MRPITFLVAITTIALMLSTTGASFDRWEPIKNLKDEHIKEIAEFAVQHSNLISIPIRSLQLLKVQKGKIQQYVAGINYKLIVSAAIIGGEGRRAKYYEAIVYENLSHVKELVSFRPLLTV
ncbi:unnamed protein product [Linum tenue]|uniref:Cystatin domain-containing protein n=1 Tax=Linum tenue TaxID=586396 RepID=A0AAV0IGR5_9ROSI|nr:unnamed protein product [Linum tenue]